MIGILDEEECVDLLGAATVGRLGFIREGRVQIIPVNYLMDGRDIVIRTVPDGIIGSLPAEAPDVAFEVDHIDGLGGFGWSVLMQGSLAVMSDDEVRELADLDRVRPWPGEGRTLGLRYVMREISGRRVRRQREHGTG